MPFPRGESSLPLVSHCFSIHVKCASQSFFVSTLSGLCDAGIILC